MYIHIYRLAFPFLTEYLINRYISFTSACSEEKRTIDICHVTDLTLNTVGRIVGVNSFSNSHRRI